MFGRPINLLNNIYSHTAFDLIQCTVDKPHRTVCNRSYDNPIAIKLFCNFL